MVNKTVEKISITEIPAAFQAEISHLATKEGFVSVESLSDYFDATGVPDLYFSSPPDGKIDVFDFKARHPIGESSPQRFFQSARWFSEQGFLAKKIIDTPQVENNPRWYQLTNNFQSVPIRHLPPQIRAVAGAVLELWRLGNSSADWRKAPSDFLTPKIVEDILGARGDHVISQENFRLFIPASYAISFRDLAAFVAFLRDIKGYGNLSDVDERDLSIGVLHIRLIGLNASQPTPPQPSLSKAKRDTTGSIFEDARLSGKYSPEAQLEEKFLKQCPNFLPLKEEVDWVLRYYTPLIHDGTRALLDQQDPQAWAELLLQSAARVFTPSGENIFLKGAHLQKWNPWCDIGEFQVGDLSLNLFSHKDDSAYVEVRRIVKHEGKDFVVSNGFDDKESVGIATPHGIYLFKKEDTPTVTAACAAGSNSGILSESRDSLLPFSTIIPLPNSCQPTNPETLKALLSGLSDQGLRSGFYFLISDD